MRVRKGDLLVQLDEAELQIDFMQAKVRLQTDETTLQRVEAHGKHLFYHWDTGEIGHVHLGLFGRFRIREDGSHAPGENVRMRLASDGVTVDLSGPTVCSLDPPDVHAAVIGRLGPDPLRRNSSPESMIDRISRSSRPIGDLLMDSR